MSQLFLYKTKLKILAVSLLYPLFRTIFGKEKIKIKRDGIFFEVDLKEGIDLSLFLFGGYQKHVVHNDFFTLKNNAVVFDVGANCGIMSLQFAKAVPHGHVYSFEPTHYAYKKLMRNIKLNPVLTSRITTIQTFISEKDSKQPELKAYSSWDISRVKHTNVHPVHLGTLKAATGIPSANLDSFCKNNKIKRLDFIKIDTDGHEAEVLKGATKVIKKYRPVIIFEVGSYLLKEKELNFIFFLEYFKKMNYSLIDTTSKKLVTKNNYAELVPQFSTTDILALPKKA